MEKTFFLGLLLFAFSDVYSQIETARSNKEFILVKSDSVDQNIFREITEYEYNRLKLTDVPDSFCFCNKFELYVKQNIRKIVELNQNKIDSLSIPELLQLVRLNNTISINNLSQNDTLFQNFNHLVNYVYNRRIITILDAKSMSAGGWYSKKYDIGFGGLYMGDVFIIKKK